MNKTQSPFAVAALSLDEDFQELERLSGQLDRLAIESDGGLEKAKELLTEFSQAGLRIGEKVQALSSTLNDARARAEDAAKRVSERAAAIQERQTQVQSMLDRFQTLAEKVRETTAGLSQLKGTVPTADLPSKMAAVETVLDTLIDEAVLLKKDAQAGRMKTLERNADSMSQSLLSARRKLEASRAPLN